MVHDGSPSEHAFDDCISCDRKRKKLKKLKKQIKKLKKRNKINVSLHNLYASMEKTHRKNK